MNHRNFERILRLWVTTSTSVSGTVPKNLNIQHTRAAWVEEGWRVSVMRPGQGVSLDTHAREARRSKDKGAEAGAEGPDDGKP